MAEIFRKSALEKLSSPDQLDKMIVIISPSFWVAMMGMGLITFAALVWSIVGRMPVSVSSSGIYMSEGGVYTQYAETSGQVDQVLVKKGESVESGATIAYIHSKELQDQINQINERVAAVNRITIESENDESTVDTKGLLDIKAQFLTLENNLKSYDSLLQIREAELNEQSVKTEKAKAEMMKAIEKYYSSMNVGDTNALQLEYQNVQSELATAKSYLESAKSTRDQFIAQGADVPLNKQADELNKQIDDLQKEYDAAKLAYDAEVEAYQTALEAYNASLEEEYEGDPVEEPATDAVDAAKNIMDGWNDQILVLKDNLNDVDIQRASISNQRNNYSQAVIDWQKKVDDLQNKFNDVSNRYLNEISKQTSKQTQSSQFGNDYSVALSNYNTELSTQKSLEDAIVQLKAQVDSETNNVNSQKEAIHSQFDYAKNSILDQLNTELQNYNKKLKDYEIKADTAGLILDLSVEAGTYVQQGSPVARFMQADDVEGMIVCYVPVNEGRKIKAGMKVMIYPTTVNRQEYGHMEGMVLRVDDYVTSSEQMMAQLGDTTLTQAFQQAGPVVAVECSLKKSSDTVSGYYWSSKKGADIMLDKGTMVATDIVTEEKAPITMLIPYLKEKLSVK